MTDDPHSTPQKSSELPEQRGVPAAESPEHPSPAPTEAAPAPAESSDAPPPQPESLTAAQQARRSGQTAAAAAPDVPSEPASGHVDAAAASKGDKVKADLPDAPPSRRSARDEAADTAAQNASALAESRRHTRRSFAVAAAASVAGFVAYEWLEKRPSDGMLPSPYRRALESNAALSRGLFQERALSPTYPLSRAETLRVNGLAGLKQMLDPASYRLQLVGARDAAGHPRAVPDVTAWQYRYVETKSTEDPGHNTKTPPSSTTPASSDTAEKMAPAPMLEQEKKRQNRSGRMPRGREEAGQSHSTLPPGTPGLLLTMEDILKLPRHELVTQFKCIEGWSQIVHWAGVRMADFLEAYPPAPVDGPPGNKEPRYVYMETPDGDYYVGYDMEVCRHPQTLLVTEMMGAPLTQFHGAPLRVHMPTKYGYKQIKRIGLIRYTNSKPDDYWTKLGYDWYAGL